MYHYNNCLHSLLEEVDYLIEAGTRWSALCEQTPKSLARHVSSMLL